MFKYLFLLCVLVSSALAVRIKTCKSTGKVDLKNIQITGCSSAKRECTFKRGEDAEMLMPFTPRNPVQNLTALVHGIIGGIPIPFHLPNSDACTDSGLTCPLGANTEVTYSAKLPVKSVYPAISVTVQWELRNEDGKDVACIKFPVKLV